MSRQGGITFLYKIVMILIQDLDKYLYTNCATAVAWCHTSTCGQRGCLLLGGCYNLLHKLNSCMNSAEPPSHVWAAHCTWDEAHLQVVKETRPDVQATCSEFFQLSAQMNESGEVMKDVISTHVQENPKPNQTKQSWNVMWQYSFHLKLCGNLQYDKSLRRAYVCLHSEWSIWPSSIFQPSSSAS